MKKILEDGKCHVSRRAKEESVPDFFPSNSTGVKRAIEFCSDCRVQNECLEYALEENLVHGIWGGMSERARVQIARASRRSLSRA
jgi:WhiB family redox-sensing transcriptional regulator